MGATPLVLLSGVCLTERFLTHLRIHDRPEALLGLATLWIAMAITGVSTYSGNVSFDIDSSPSPDPESRPKVETSTSGLSSRVIDRWSPKESVESIHCSTCVFLEGILRLGICAEFLMPPQWRVEAEPRGRTAPMVVLILGGPSGLIPLAVRVHDGPAVETRPTNSQFTHDHGDDSNTP